MNRKRKEYEDRWHVPLVHPAKEEGCSHGRTGDCVDCRMARIDKMILMRQKAREALAPMRDFIRVLDECPWFRDHVDVTDIFKAQQILEDLCSNAKHTWYYSG